MTDPTNAAAPAANDLPTPEQIAAAKALLATAAAAKPLPAAMAEMCADPRFTAGLEVMAEYLSLYPSEPSNDLSYGVMSMNRLVARYGA